MVAGILSGGKGGDFAGDWWGRILTFDASKASESYGRDNTTEVRPYNLAFLICRKD